MPLAQTLTPALALALTPSPDGSGVKLRLVRTLCAPAAGIPRPAPIFAHTLRSKADACSRHPPDPQPQASPIPAQAPIPPQVREALLRPPENRIKPTCRRYPSVEPCQLRKRAPYRRRRIGTAAGGGP